MNGDTVRTDFISAYEIMISVCGWETKNSEEMRLWCGKEEGKWALENS